MKTKHLLAGALCVGLFTLTGCAGMSKVAKELKGDPATVASELVTPYGNHKFFRTQVGTNQTLTRSPDGTIKIESK